MRDLSRVIRPLVAIVAAVAVAVGAAVIGARFAAPTSVHVEPGVVTAPVLAPIGFGEEQPETEGIESEAVAEREVTLPGAPVDEVPPVARVVLDEMGGSLDPLATLGVLEGEAAAEAPPTDGDPCAPREGEPADSCPDGIESTVISLVSPRPAGVGGQAFPPTYEQYLAEGNPYGGSLWCDGLEVGDGDVPFGILATTPGVSTVSYWPTDDPDDITTLAPIGATEAEIAEYESALATATDPLDVPLARGCLVIPGLPAGTDYSARILHADIFDRLATSTIERFNTDGAPTRPGAQIAVLGDNFVFAGGLHRPGDTVDARAWLYDDVASASCSGAGSDGQVSPATAAETTVDQDFLSRINALPEYTGKSVFTFRVPEGATVIVCLRWFPGGDAPSWEREQHDYESEVVLQSPDRILPVISLADLRVAGDHVAAIRTSASTAEGGSCGYFPTYRAGGELRLPATLCDEGALVEGGIRVDDDSIHDVGFSGDILITSQTELVDGAESSASWLLPLSRSLCRGSCELPDTSWYTVRTYGESVDFAQTVIRVDWTQGRQNGLLDWNVLPSADAEVGYASPSLPQLDTGTEVRVTVNEPLLRASADYLLEVDRPVTYTARLRGESGGEPCLVDAALPTVRTGTASATLGANVGFAGLCLGRQYLLEIELTDTATGLTALWGLVDRSTWWGNSLFDVPGLDVTISYDWMAQGVARSAMTELDLTIERLDLEPVNGRGGPCTVDGIVSGSDSRVAATLSSSPRISFAVRLRPSDDFAEGDCFGSLRPGDRHEIVTFVSLADLLEPEGVIIEVPEARARLHFWAYRP